ncbi:hypothetical protein [Saliphagus sp. LR7]|uniref:hypothetical protein n=1 Tax=Saliphagus sp. LR7 TaxID=2282654 RepID=UPI000DF76989|nr:hypothetical protein [Saliphagus sp. LR7]
MSADTRDAGAPDGVEELVVRSGQGGRDRKFHIPASDEGTDTLCKISKKSNNLYRKPVEAYPRGWFGWCDRCLDEREWRGNR